MMRSYFLSVLLLFYSFVETRAQNVKVSALLDTGKALIGDYLKLRLSVEKPAEIRVDFPLFSDTISKDIEVITAGNRDTVLASGDKQIINQEIILSVYDTGYFVVPPLNFIVYTRNIQDTLNTLPVYFQIVPLEMDSALRDIKAIEKVPVGFRDLLPYLSGLIIIAVMVWILIRYVKRRKNKIIKPTPTSPAELPEVAALRELNSLKEEKPWKHNMIKQYHIRLSEILRRYLEGRYNFSAMELTTGEILQSLKTLKCSDHDVRQVTGILNVSDLVKFAKAVPGEGENALQVDLAISFVKNTTPDTDLKQGVTDLMPDKEVINNANYA